MSGDTTSTLGPKSGANGSTCWPGAACAAPAVPATAIMAAVTASATAAPRGMRVGLGCVLIGCVLLVEGVRESPLATDDDVGRT